MEKLFDVNDPKFSHGRKTVIRKGAPPPREEKDPAEAYSRSMLYWGGGQFYNDEVVKGTIYLVMAFLLLAGLSLAVIYRIELVQALRDGGISVSDAFLGAEAALLLVLVFWAYNAGDAYHKAARSRRTRFTGVKSKVTPLLASLVIPGWGQFLNGQPLKGSFLTGLAVIGLFSVLSVLLSFLAWPVLDAGDARFLVEGISAVCLVIVPFMPPLWALSAYDALKVSLDDLLKEPLWERIKAAYYRGRNQGWMEGVFPRLKGTFMLLLFLVFFVIVVYYWFPVQFYAGILAWTKTTLSERGMTIIPELLDRALTWLAATGR